MMRYGKKAHLSKGAARLRGLAVICFIVVAGGLPADDTRTVNYTEQREPCSNRNPVGNPYFGDLHVHTAYSFDSYGNGTRILPDDAYRYAKGGAIGLPPYDSEGKPSRVVSIDRPLDFVAITDHAEYFGEMDACLDPDSPSYETSMCSELRIPGPESYVAMAPTIVLPTPRRMTEICGEDGQNCERRIPSVWAKVRDFADDAYDRSAACTFTAFVGYEYSGVPMYRNLHRNVIFRNSIVPQKPITYVEAPTGPLLWKQLISQCIDRGNGCDALAIPHNPNLSNGALLAAITDGTLSEQREMAQMRQVAEPLMEIFQHKGNSECMNGLSGVLGAPDELCEVEQVRKLGSYSSYKNIFAEVTDCKGELGFLGLFNGGCVAYNDFFRGASLLGLKEEARLGVNPLKMGVVAATDTHVGTAGGVDEKTWPGHIVYETTLEKRLGSGYLPSNLNGNPGGLSGVWALENSRDALFDAMKRRETFATSGTRITPRFFASWKFDPDLCSRKDQLELAYETGVPMGGDLAPAAGKSQAPMFLASALRDPDARAMPLQKLQIVKGWLDAEGKMHQKVFDVAGDTEEPVLEVSSKDGYAQLCTTFADPEFDPTAPSFYYLRVVEQASPRWSAFQCDKLTPRDRPAGCDNDAPRLIHEMGWTSPIWYSP